MMRRKLAGVWVSLAVLFSSLLIAEVIVDFTPTVSGGTTLYVNETGSNGAYTSIQDAINASKDGDTVFVYNGTYLEDVVVNKSINLVGEDRITTWILDGGNGNGVGITADWVNITGFTVISTEMDGGGIKLSNVKNCNITNNNAWADQGNGIYLYNSSGNDITGNDASGWLSGIRLECSNGNDIINNSASFCSSRGIIIYSSERNNIIDNNVSNNHWGISILKSNRNNITGNTITGNTIASHNSPGIELWQYSSNNNITDNTLLNNDLGISLEYYSSRNYISGNKVYSNEYYGIHLVRWCDENNITDNNVSNSEFGIYLHNSNRSSIIGNNVSNNDHGIYIYNSSGNDITGSDAFSNAFPGIYLNNSSDNNITRNNASKNGYHGIHFESLSNSNLIIDNNVSSNNFSGIYLTSSDSNNIASNTASNNGYHGVLLEGSSNNNITGNNVSLNNLDGLRLLSSSKWNSIIGNTVFSNSNYGIYINGSSDNSIYHNSIIDNTNQAYDDTNNGNQWDNGYPSGGNYWSDFDEPSEGAYDDFNGMDQDILGSDGIVDNGTAAGGGKNPYVIDADSQDNYPFIAPYKNYMILKQGWNLISIPLIQVEQNLTKVLASIDGLYNAVQWYDITDKNDPWKHYRPGKPYGNDLFQINETMGFWIHIIPSGDTIFYYDGVKPAQNQKITLHQGWNLVGYPSLSNKIRTAALNNIDFGVEVDAIWTFNATLQKWKEIGASDYFELCRGYWIHAITDCVWEVPL